MSAANRNRGHNAERNVVKWLKTQGYEDARTTRAALGHDGAHAPGDVIGPVGLVIEVKDVARTWWQDWSRQADEEANGRPWVVVRRLRGVKDVGAWPCCYRTEDMLRLSRPVLTFAEFLAAFEGDR